jgi:hypothetical protein
MPGWRSVFCALTARTSEECSVIGMDHTLLKLQIFISSKSQVAWLTIASSHAKLRKDKKERLIVVVAYG